MLKRCLIMSLFIAYFIVISPSSLISKNGNFSDHYLMKLDFYSENFTINGYTILSHINRLDKTFKEIYMHIYPNAYKSYGGGIYIHSILNLGTKNYLKYDVMGDDKTVLRIYLDTELKKFDKIILNISYTIYIPHIGDRFGFNRDIYALGNCFPILAVYDDEGWNLDPYVFYGESFYSHVADYDVYIKIKKDFIIAATGVLVNTTYSNGYKIEHWVGKNIREFAFVASKFFEVYKILYNNITIYSYYLPEAGSMGIRAAEIARQALKVFGEHYGPYVYPEYRVVAVDFWAGGMEYPSLIMIATSLYDPNKREVFELVIAHETGHQWWYGMVGDDENDEPWLDEGLTEYATIMYFEWTYGRATGRRIFNKYYKNRFYRFIDRYKSYDKPIASTMYDFRGASFAYFYIVYKKGACVLDMLRYILGDDIFFDIFRTLYNRFKFKTATIRDFINIAEEVSGRDLDWFFDFWLYDKGLVKYRIKNATISSTFSGYRLNIYIVQEEPSYNIEMIVPILLKTSSGNRYVWVWVNKTSGIISIDVDEKVLSIQIDPEDYILGRDDTKVVTVVEEVSSIPTDFLIQALSISIFCVIDAILITYLKRKGIVK